MNKKSINYKSAGVDIDAGNEAVDLIKDQVKSTFSKNVLTNLGGFGSLFDLKEIINDYTNPILVQSIDGVGTKTIIARMMNDYTTIGIDLLSACANDILVMGAKPLTFLDYIANAKLNPLIVKEIVSGMVSGCINTNVSLVGGETAEMPDTYLPGEHDLVGIISGVVEKEKIITGNSIKPGDIAIGLPSNGLHTNGYSLARKLFFEIANNQVRDNLPNSDMSIGEALLLPHINYTNHIFSLLDQGIKINGISHITGGGFIENIPRILPKNCNVEINKDSWPSLPVFNEMQKIGNLEKKEMYRTFNMGIGIVIIVDPSVLFEAKTILQNHSEVYDIGLITPGSKKTIIN